MRLAVADPPYLGRADRWYGTGRASGRERTAPGGVSVRADSHPDAAVWDTPDRHATLVRELSAEYDGWALAAAPDYLGLLLAAAPATARVAVWHRRNAVPGGSRVVCSWEPVVYVVPRARRGRDAGLVVRDVLDAPVLRQGFVGAKPPAWTAWVLALLGYVPGSDQLVDLFPGSGAVAFAADALLPIGGEYL